MSKGQEAMKKLLMGKATGIVEAIDAMDVNQRQQPPSRGFGEDYNALLRSLP